MEKILEIIIVFVLILFFLVIPISGILAAAANVDAANAVCDEHCSPYKVLDCSRQDGKIFHPKYVDVLVVCAGGEKQVKRIVK